MEDPLLDVIAEDVHKGWMAEKRRQGYADHVFHVDVLDNPDTATRCRKSIGTYDACTLPRDKHHTDMLPYADLAPHVQEYDRVTARAVLAGLQRRGYTLLPPEDSGES